MKLKLFLQYIRIQINIYLKIIVSSNQRLEIKFANNRKLIMQNSGLLIKFYKPTMIYKHLKLM